MRNFGGKFFLELESGGTAPGVVFFKRQDILSLNTTEGRGCVAGSWSEIDH